MTPIGRLLSRSQMLRQSSMTSRRAPLLRVRVIVVSAFATSRPSWTLPYGRASEMRKTCGYWTLLDQKTFPPDFSTTELLHRLPEPVRPARER